MVIKGGANHRSDIAWIYGDSLVRILGAKFTP
jgi:hypothetical protein